MSEWWTYRLSNFLLFSPRTYYRLFELYNAAIWPAQAAAALAGIAVLYCLLRPSRGRGRIAAVILAASWTWVAVAFLAKRYATINFAAVQFAWGFGIEAALLVWTGVIRAAFGAPKPRGARAGGAGLWICAFGIALHPFLGPLLGREWRGIEIFGVAPDPTAIATLGAVLSAAGRARWHLLVIPILWCGISGATLLAMKDSRCWILFAAAVIALFAAFRKRSTPSPRRAG
ncbi:MAG TPA: DUF6064 family protein [Thermoanaerobaculia bacterium]|nr:DUF6064 family protein [Thermoanaerobaculia bacterium]